jgi:hypothetical protein
MFLPIRNAREMRLLNGIKLSILRARIGDDLFPAVQSWRTIGASLLTRQRFYTHTRGNNSFGEQPRVLRTLVIYLTQKYIHGNTYTRGYILKLQ